MKIANHTYTDPSDNFIITAPTYKILQQATLPAYLHFMRGYGDYSKADSVFRIHGGGTVYCRTGTDPDSVIGITNVRHIWGDEAGLYSLYFWENLQARAAFREAGVTLTTSPYTLNWIFKEIIRPLMKDPNARPDVELIQAASWENPLMKMAVIEQAKKTMDPRRFNALFGGQWERMAGLVYDCFDEIENQCEAIMLPVGTRFVGGVDWGYTEPFVFKIRAITPTGQHYGVHEFYKSGLTINDMVAVVKRLQAVYDLGLVYCDPSQPGYIEEMCRKGIKAVPANNDVRVGIDRHYEMLKTRRLKYFKGQNPYTLDELDTYHYPSPDDLKPDQNAKDQTPVQQNDHALDAERYISIMTFASDQKNSPFVPQEVPKKSTDPHKDLSRLLKGPRRGGAEEW
jgi:hypothetical protein